MEAIPRPCSPTSVEVLARVLVQQVHEATIIKKMGGPATPHNIVCVMKLCEHTKVIFHKIF